MSRQRRRSPTAPLKQSHPMGRRGSTFHAPPTRPARAGTSSAIATTPWQRPPARVGATRCASGHETTALSRAEADGSCRAWAHLYCTVPLLPLVLFGVPIFLCRHTTYEAQVTLRLETTRGVLTGRGEPCTARTCPPATKSGRRPRTTPSRTRCASHAWQGMVRPQMRPCRQVSDEPNASLRTLGAEHRPGARMCRVLPHAGPGSSARAKPTANHPVSFSGEHLAPDSSIASAASKPDSPNAAVQAPGAAPATLPFVGPQRFPTPERAERTSASERPSKSHPMHRPREYTSPARRRPLPRHTPRSAGY
jgi:hypothetical protein